MSQPRETPTPASHTTHRPLPPLPDRLSPTDHVTLLQALGHLISGIQILRSISDVDEAERFQPFANHLMSWVLNHGGTQGAQYDYWLGGTNRGNAHEKARAEILKAMRLLLSHSSDDVMHAIGGLMASA